MYTNLAFRLVSVGDCVEYANSTQTVWGDTARQGLAIDNNEGS